MAYDINEEIDDFERISKKFWQIEQEQKIKEKYEDEYYEVFEEMEGVSEELDTISREFIKKWTKDLKDIRKREKKELNDLKKRKENNYPTTIHSTNPTKTFKSLSKYMKKLRIADENPINSKY